MWPVVRLTTLAVLCLFLSGCGTTPEQRMAMVQSYIEAGQRASASLDDAIAATELVLDQAAASLNDPNLPAKEVQQILAMQKEARDQLAAFRAKKTMLDNDLARWKDLLAQAQAKGVGVFDEVQLYGEGLRALGNQVGGNVGGYVSLAGALVAAISGALAGIASQRNKTTQTRKTLEGVVGSVSALLASDAVVDRDKATNVLQAAQLPEVRSEVRQVLGKQ